MRIAAGMLPCALAGGCHGPPPVVMEGDENSVAVAYVGDLSGVNEAARRHCARYERMPRLDQVQPNTAYFDCVRP
jgi:hypothetical protein